MLVIHTQDGTHTIDATANDVSEKNNRLTIMRGTTPIAVFRRWTSWYEQADPQ